MTDDVESKAQFARRLGITRQRVGQLARAGLPTDDQGRVRVTEALAHLRETGGARSQAAAAARCTAPAEPDVNLSVADLAELHADTDAQRGAILATLRAQRRWPALAALAALEEGMSVDAAKRLYSHVQAVTAEDGQELLAGMGVRSFADGDPSVWGPVEFEPNFEAASGRRED